MILPSGPVPERGKGKSESILSISNMALLLKVPVLFNSEKSLNTTPGSQLHSQEEQENMDLQGQKTVRAKKWKGKVPFTWVRSIPFSAANFFARGLTTTLPPLRGGPAVGAAGAGAAAGWGGGGAAAGVAITLTKNQNHQWNTQQESWPI